MEQQVIETVSRSTLANQPVALITVTASTGTSPARVGAIMAVRGDGTSVGTIGGGDLEFQAIREASICLATNTSREMVYTLHESRPEPSCGEQVHLFIKVFAPQATLLLAGAGHVNYELYRQGILLGFRVIVVDDRQELLNAERFAGAECFFAENIPTRLGAMEIDDKTFISIATRSHEGDRLALTAVAGSSAAYVGMIGSSKKIRHTFEYLREEGIAEEKIKTIYAPMGLNIATTQPREIAVSIISEMLMVKNGGSPEQMRTIKKIL